MPLRFAGNSSGRAGANGKALSRIAFCCLVLFRPVKYSRTASVCTLSRVLAKKVVTGSEGAAYNARGSGMSPLPGVGSRAADRAGCPVLLSAHPSVVPGASPFSRRRRRSFLWSKDLWLRVRQQASATKGLFSPLGKESSVSGVRPSRCPPPRYPTAMLAGQPRAREPAGRGEFQAWHMASSLSSPVKSRLDLLNLRGSARTPRGGFSHWETPPLGLPLRSPELI